MEVWDRSWLSNPPFVILWICFFIKYIYRCLCITIIRTSETVIVFNASYTEGSIWPLVWMIGDPCMLLPQIPLPYGCAWGSLREFMRGFGSVTLLWREWHLSRTQPDKVVLLAIRESINETDATERLEIRGILRMRIYSFAQMDWECVQYMLAFEWVCVQSWRPPSKGLFAVNSPPITDSLYPLQGKCHSIDSTLFLPCVLLGRFSNAILSIAICIAMFFSLSLFKRYITVIKVLNDRLAWLSQMDFICCSFIYI